MSGKRAKRYLQREHLLALGPPALAYLTELTHRRPKIWIRDVDRLHGLLATYGDAALRAAFERGLAEQTIGAEYIAHFLATTVTPATVVEREQSLVDLPSAIATTAPRGAQVQAAAGARRAGAKRRASTRASTALLFDADGGRS